VYTIVEQFMHSLGNGW